MAAQISQELEYHSFYCAFLEKNKMREKPINIQCKNLPYLIPGSKFQIYKSKGTQSHGLQSNCSSDSLEDM